MVHSNQKAQKLEELKQEEEHVNVNERNGGKIETTVAWDAKQGVVKMMIIKF